jgi:hypothetical protein
VLSNPDDDFPPWNLFWRTWFETERVLSTLPMLIVTPTFAALVATVWAVSTPATMKLHGAVVLVPPSLGDSVLTAVIGGAVGIAAVISGVFVLVLVRYLAFGDRVWDAGHVEAGGSLYFELRCLASAPRMPETLGALGCTVRTPSGRLWLAQGANFIRREGSPGGIVARSELPTEPGRYEVRWYAEENKGRVHEIARAKVEIDANANVRRLPRPLGLRSAINDVMGRLGAACHAVCHDPPVSRDCCLFPPWWPSSWKAPAARAHDAESLDVAGMPKHLCLEIGDGHRGHGRERPKKAEPQDQPTASADGLTPQSRSSGAPGPRT